ncbi:MAG TPA: hypothetical protein VLA64_00630 [Azonexus sp.]|nr:hypothetical protein [Azonexus sp.]
MLQSHWSITGKRRHVEIEEYLNQRAKPAAPCRPPEIPPDREPPAIDDPPPDVVPVPVREPPATPGLVMGWLAGVLRRSACPARRRRGVRRMMVRDLL